MHSPIKRNALKQKKTKARLSRLLQRPAWKLRQHTLVPALHRSVTHLLT